MKLIYNTLGAASKDDALANMLREFRYQSHHSFYALLFHHSILTQLKSNSLSLSVTLQNFEHILVGLNL